MNKISSNNTPVRRLCLLRLIIASLLAAAILLPRNAFADDGDEEESMLHTLLVFGRTPEGWKKKGPRLFTFQLRAGAHVMPVRFENIPDSVRTVHPYNRSSMDVQLPEDTKDTLVGATYGFGIYVLRRFEVAVDFATRMDGASGYIWFPSNDAVGYVPVGKATTLTLSSRVLYGLHVKMGYCSKWLELYSGVDAWATFRPQHHRVLPRRDLMLFGGTYKVLQPFFKWYDDWFDIEVDYGMTISPEHDASSYVSVRMILQTYPLPFW